MADGKGFDFSPGAQVPLIGTEGGTAATQALSSAAYRDSPVEDLRKANEDAVFTPPRLSLFEPNLGEAFARSVQVRMLGAARGELVQSFGAEPQSVVEHCLAANRIRQERDNRLTIVMAVFGLLFLPGVLIWLGAFQLRRSLAKAQDSKAGPLGAVILLIVVAFAALLIIKPPLTGFWRQYLRVMMLVPVLGWFWAKRICEQTAKDLRERWAGLVSGTGVGAKIPEAVPRNPNQTRAETLRQSLAKLSAEQNSNVVFYAGPKGILGMGTRWGSWQMAEELVPRDGLAEIHPFRSWDVIRAIHDKLRMLERGPLHTGGFPKASIRHWVVAPTGENAKAISRPTGAEVEAFTVKDFEIQRICNNQQFGKGNRHYLGIQFVLWDGQLVITLMVTVTVLAQTLRVEVTGHALGPVHPIFTAPPAPNSKTVSHPVKFWETHTVQLPLIHPGEVVRLAARAPLTRFPSVLDHLGGTLALPEPFGLRHTWADKPWKHRFMADDALRAATPVLRAVHAAAIHVMKENGVDTSHFTNRSLMLSGLVQGAEPRKADAYDA
ncbi:hypothetical protein G3I60_34510 [Streptomyces sp. SID13666]|uniref:hypothetical protein n=1 Tax=Streptomyces TaxID=1883 RepID=UPI0011062915|nr:MULTISPECIES: hypothetical protein [Streptomyces]MCZ4097525.1 hypothetical protein [Streptomyces sp. H39-C1]NEA59137.1 hypothetical protein [Streptomyces sp. SID13666]NEA75175.1 hypothetical protein [Streptomyces sp. SID13588]QNA72426.1 hypothetical protein C8250_011305 [Streptomyces sp. So13.3]